MVSLIIKETDMKKGIVGIVCLALLFVGCHRFDGEEIEYESTTGV